MQTLEHSPHCGKTAKKTAGFCGFAGGCLRFVKVFMGIIGSERAFLDQLKSSALFCCAKCLYECFSPVARALSKYDFSAQSSRREQGHVLAFFLGNSL